MIVRKKFLVLLVVAALLPVVLLAADVLLFVKRPLAPPQEQLVTIAPGSSLRQIAALLEEQQVVERAFYFIWLARWREQAGLLQAGQYRFREAARPDEVLERLVRGDVVRIPFTVAEGLSLAQIATRLQQQELGDSERFLSLARDPEFVRQLGIEAQNLEGYLFPETYLLEQGFSEQRLLRAMVGQFQLRALEEWQLAAAERGLDRHQWVTLASIVEKEAGSVDEMPLIAGVFHNRLRLGMLLQADPTVIYGIEDEEFDGRIRRRHLDQWTPYNTYRIRGLPPGPIASPGEAALRASAFPAETDYLYFVSRGDGSHHFSRTLGEHNQAVRKYILSPRRTAAPPLGTPRPEDVEPEPQ